MTPGGVGQIEKNDSVTSVRDTVRGKRVYVVMVKKQIMLNGSDLEMFHYYCNLCSMKTSTGGTQQEKKNIKT